jgi:biopolymer transport protein ExbD
MKLEMTLPERPGLLHAVPLLNIFALLQLFFLLGPALVLQSGVTVDLPPSKFQMERYQNSIVVSLGPGDTTARIHLGRDAVTLEQLKRHLDDVWPTLTASDAARIQSVLFQTLRDLRPSRCDQERRRCATGRR